MLNLSLVHCDFVVQPRSVDPSKDTTAYGYGSVVWKERMDSRKYKQKKSKGTRSEHGRDDVDHPL